MYSEEDAIRDLLFDHENTTIDPQPGPSSRLDVSPRSQLAAFLQSDEGYLDEGLGRFGECSSADLATRGRAGLVQGNIRRRMVDQTIRSRTLAPCTPTYDDRLLNSVLARDSGGLLGPRERRQYNGPSARILELCHEDGSTITTETESLFQPYWIRLRTRFTQLGYDLYQAFVRDSSTTRRILHDSINYSEKRHGDFTKMVERLQQRLEKGSGNLWNLHTDTFINY